MNITRAPRAWAELMRFLRVEETTGQLNTPPKPVLGLVVPTLGLREYLERFYVVESTVDLSGGAGTKIPFYASPQNQVNRLRFVFVRTGITTGAKGLYWGCVRAGSHNYELVKPSYTAAYDLFIPGDGWLAEPGDAGFAVTTTGNPADNAISVSVGYYVLPLVEGRK